MKTTKYVIIIFIGLFLLAGGFILLKLIAEPQGIMQSLPFILIGVGCGVFGFGLGETVRILTLRKHPEPVSYTHLDVYKRQLKTKMQRRKAHQ